MPLRDNVLKDNYQNQSLAFFGACCLFLSAIEYSLPKPLPFMRIGLANLPLMLALTYFPLKEFLILVCIKIFGQALITGTLFSYIFLFSFAGTFSSALLMLGLKRIFNKHISFIGIGTAGAMVSNGTQLALAYFFIFGESVKYIAPVFLAVGLASGILLGALCEKINLSFAEPQRQIKEESGKTLCNADLKKNIVKSNSLFFIGMTIMPLIVFNPSTELRAAVFIVLWLLAIILKKKTNPLLTIAFLFIVIALNLIIPQGKVLFSVGFFKITSGALNAGIHRAVTIQALFMLSKLIIKDDLKLPGKFGNLLSDSLRIFSVMINKKSAFKGKSIIPAIHDILSGRL